MIAQFVKRKSKGQQTILVKVLANGYTTGNLPLMVDEQMKI